MSSVALALKRAAITPRGPSGIWMISENGTTLFRAAFQRTIHPYAELTGLSRP
ncbi:hypothetical protein [Aquidulcibacter paucihalophilus]|uniref:hypothetical protein n=1 Tax=Aquidulcibacter paucihalophilus TaxID=1978549 RepID=UPI0012FF9D0D|nr:hypothetical protein [Aquidulcibacter paucihalophilus]